MQGRLVFKNNQQMLRAKAMGITDIHKIYEIEDLVKKDVIFAATGFTDGLLVNGVQKYYDKFTTETLWVGLRLFWFKIRHRVVRNRIEEWIGVDFEFEIKNIKQVSGKGRSYSNK